MFVSSAFAQTDENIVARDLVLNWAQPEYQVSRLIQQEVRVNVDPSHIGLGARLQLVVDGNRVLQEFTRAINASWSVPVPGNVLLRYVSPLRDDYVLILSISLETHTLKDETQVGSKWDSVPIVRVGEHFRTLGDSVGHVRYMDLTGKPQTCTSFLIDAQHILSNEHCLSADNAVLSSIVVDFGFESWRVSPERIALDISFTPICSKPLDVCVGRLLKSSPRKVLPWSIPTKTASSPTRDPAGLLIFHHPKGRPKEVAFGKECMTAVIPEFGNSKLAHTCDTAYGSSGSPVLDAISESVIAVHRQGYEDWNEFKVNVAIPGYLVGPFLEAKAPTVWKKMIVSTGAH